MSGVQWVIEIDPTQGGVEAKGTWIKSPFANDFGPKGFPGNSIYNSTGATGDELQFPLLMDKGTWDIWTIYSVGPPFGKCAVLLDAVEEELINMDSGSAESNKVAHKVGVSVASTGEHTLAFKATGEVDFNWVKLVRTA